MKKIKKGIKFILFILAGILLFSISLPNNLFAQGMLNASISNQSNLNGHQADRWYFGKFAGLDFRQQDPVADLSNDSIFSNISLAIIADSAGDILFITNGRQAYNRFGQKMPNGDSLHGYYGNTMPALIIPKIGDENLFYIFTTHRPWQNPGDPGPFYGLEYHVVNMKLDGGLGDVTLKNIVMLGPEVSAKLCAVKQANGIDYWVVAHRFDSDEFCSFRVTSYGVDTNSYVSSHIGAVHAAPGEMNNAVGFMKISPDGSKLALAIFGSDIIEIFDFNNSTGNITNVISSGPVFDEVFGIEFSPDSRYLYATTTSASMPMPVYTPPSYLYQFDVNRGDEIFSHGFYNTIAIDTSGSYFGGMQLGTDGRIYVSRSPYDSAALSVIVNPKRHGDACNFTANAIDLQGRSCRFGFPNFVSTYFDLPHFEVSNTAFGDTVVFTLQNNSNIDEIIWQFGDPASGSNTSSEMQPRHVFSSPGIYQVQVTEYFNGLEYGSYSHTIEVINYQEIHENISNHSLLSIYPNPGNGNINLVFKEDVKEAVISVRNIFGQQVWGPVKLDGLVENEEIGLNLDHLPAGLYFIEIFNEEHNALFLKYQIIR